MDKDSRRILIADLGVLTGSDPSVETDPDPIFIEILDPLPCFKEIVSFLTL